MNQLTPEQQEEEESHFQKVLQAFRGYRRYALELQRHRVKNFVAMPASHIKLLGNEYQTKLKQTAACIAQNATLLEEIAMNFQIFNNQVT